mmetsp:Transcript_125995/g.268842  ORF Transcript_125995/g.268842 Transcript_125995/m.268842 type:complete len:99 (-) Transcript_125995:1531-1827(-)
MTWSNVSCTARSFTGSNAAVASSKRITFGFRIKTRAMARRCIWPPLKPPPVSVSTVSSLSGFASIKSQACAFFRASVTASVCSRLASSSVRPCQRLTP